MLRSIRLFNFIYALLSKVLIPFVKELVLHKGLSPSDRKKRVLVLVLVTMLVSVVYLYANLDKIKTAPPPEARIEDTYVVYMNRIRTLESQIVLLEHELADLKTGRVECANIPPPVEPEYRLSPYDRLKQLEGR